MSAFETATRGIIIDFVKPWRRFVGVLLLRICRPCERTWTLTALPLFCLGLMAWGMTGCAASQSILTNGWYADYEVAEEQHHATGQPLLIYYRRHSVRRDTLMETRLKDPELSAHVNGFMRCKLFRSHEPHRRYMAQYGVDRAPALVIVHPDGSYHRLIGLATNEKLVAFLQESAPPGEWPIYDPLLPRKRDYAWHDTLAKAERDAEERERPVLFVLTESMSGQWDEMKKLFAQRAVHIRCRDVTTCHLDSWSADAGRIVEESGVQYWPALVLRMPGGGIAILEQPDSYEQVCRFLDRPDLNQNGGLQQDDSTKRREQPDDVTSQSEPPVGVSGR
ncbi:MAG: hypothetical protein ACPGXK_06665 [Phycisphaerae bacterium]